MSGRVSYEAGRLAEEQVAAVYARKGMELAARRWRGTVGEIDLILRDGEDLVFVEVKKAPSHAQAAERLDARQMARICASATEFVAGEPRGQLTGMRFDVALVDAAGCIELREAAFWGH